MKLMDFKQDEKFNQLRSKMGTDELGNFELFNPDIHLSWQERKVLSKEWIDISSGMLHGYMDQTLAYKNSHVFNITDDKFHFSLCDKLKKRMSQGRLVDTQVTLNQELLKGKGVCEYCLHAVSYQGFDAYRHRHQEYNQKIILNFKLVNYLSRKYKL